MSGVHLAIVNRKQSMLAFHSTPRVLEYILQIEATFDSIDYLSIQEGDVSERLVHSSSICECI